GLCLGCHNGSAAGVGLRNISSAMGSSPTIHVHRTVMGWSSDFVAANIFTTAMYNEHEMGYKNSQSGTDSVCSSSTYYEAVPGGYRWSVNPGSSPGTAPSSAGSGAYWTAAYRQPQFHQYPCSKCHAPHTSKLPRLMKTNCLDVGSSASTTPKHGSGYSYQTGCGNSTLTSANKPMVCHNLLKVNSAGTSRGWNARTGW
ncbi:MAG: hypothetical protein ABSG42_05485, partial [Nitrospirota bacterium]